MVFNIQRASFHDGPGIRTTVFLKGCPLHCPWCHNPEGLFRQPQVGFDEGRCLGCGACRECCPRPGGPLPPGALVASAGCAACGGCFDACPGAARRQVGWHTPPDTLLTDVLRDRPFWETSGGGVTFSGGEPLAQAEFLDACLAGCRRAGVHTAVDTCGAANREAVMMAARGADLLLWDVKHTDPEQHLRLTGAPLAPILANLAAAADTGVVMWLRVPVIAGVNDDDATMAAVARLAANTPGVRRISLLPHHRMGAGKLSRLGGNGGAREFRSPTPERLGALSALVAAGGVETTVGG